MQPWRTIRNGRRNSQAGFRFPHRKWRSCTLRCSKGRRSPYSCMTRTGTASWPTRGQRIPSERPAASSWNRTSIGFPRGRYRDCSLKPGCAWSGRKVDGRRSTPPRPLDGRCGSTAAWSRWGLRNDVECSSRSRTSRKGNGPRPRPCATSEPSRRSTGCSGMRSSAGFLPRLRTGSRISHKVWPLPGPAGCSSWIQRGCCGRSSAPRVRPRPAPRGSRPGFSRP